MDFFGQQDRARRSTRRLVGLFVLAVAAIVAAVYLVVVVLLFGAGWGPRGIPLWDPALLVAVAGSTVLVVAGGSLFKIWQLSSGGSAVAELLGGRPIDPNTSDPDERRLLNVVEEMALAAGTPVPDVYLLPDERSVNAFAAGFSREDAVIGVTQGTVRLLDRDELQGVVGHEMSHVLNGDMRLNLRLMGVLHGILVISMIGYMLLRSGGSGRRRERSALPLVGLALYLVGWIGVLFGRFIKAGVSRQREFLADASAVQFTRDPSGIAGALATIGGWERGSRIGDSHAEEASHLFFADGLKRRFFAWTATHPPLEERIRRIDPSWDGSWPRVEWPEEGGAEEAPAAPERLEELLGGVGRAAEEVQRAGGGVAGVLDPAAVAASVGTLDPLHVAWAAALIEALSPELVRAAREPGEARELVYALLFHPADGSDEAGSVRERQRGIVARRAGPRTLATVEKLLPTLDEAPRGTRLALADLVLPALRRMSAEQYRSFRATLKELAEADRRIDLFEYALRRMVLRHLEPQYRGPGDRTAQYYSLGRLGSELSCLLSALGRAGHEDEEAVRGAVEAGAVELGAAGAEIEIEVLEPSACGLAAFDRALDRLALAAPALRERVLRAAVATVLHDRRVDPEEAELVRAVADALDCPVPPFLIADPARRGEALSRSAGEAPAPG